MTDNSLWNKLPCRRLNRWSKTRGQTQCSGGLRIASRCRPRLHTGSAAARNALDSEMKAALDRGHPEDRPRRRHLRHRAALEPARRVLCRRRHARNRHPRRHRSPAARQALAAEYSLVWLMECLSKPVIALIDGGVMGGGAGIPSSTPTGRRRGYGFAMPEVHIGFFPDDGVAHALARLPGEIGEYLALTGRRVGRGRCIRARPRHPLHRRRHFDHIERGLANADPVDPLLDALHRDPGPGEIGRTPVDRRCFAGASVEEITARACAAATPSAWAAGELADIERASPLALKVALRHVREARALDLRQTLGLDYRLGVRMIAAPDFAGRAREPDRQGSHTAVATAHTPEISDAFIDESVQSRPRKFAQPADAAGNAGRAGLKIRIRTKSTDVLRLSCANTPELFFYYTY